MIKIFEISLARQQNCIQNNVFLQLNNKQISNLIKICKTFERILRKRRYMNGE